MWRDFKQISSIYMQMYKTRRRTIRSLHYDWKTATLMCFTEMLSSTF